MRKNALDLEHFLLLYARSSAAVDSSAEATRVSAKVAAERILLSYPREPAPAPTVWEGRRQSVAAKLASIVHTHGGRTVLR
jgi:hypothetical protein